MPLPPHPLIVNGGCNCGAIRYRISIPSISQRPLHPSSPPDSKSPVHLPFIAIDHCNDCRRATGSILPTWLCAPISIITSSLVVRSSAPPSERTPSQHTPSSNINEKRTAYLPASEIFTPGPGAISSDSFLTFYESSENRRRSFCGRCGTNLSYEALPMPDGWPGMLDVVLGTVDRGDLEGGELRPERVLWCEKGVGWVRELVVGGIGDVERHPGYKVDEFC